ncbi:ATP-binding protein [Streptomyces avicenniae]|uniref:ATP-binding protein n=1 Tax=Streptomyces avicenniae TaxID=500153 RepID=UPI00069C68BA|nr:ATP-binding protein [Streptomyces avicenniae]
MNATRPFPAGGGDPGPEPQGQAAVEASGYVEAVRDAIPHGDPDVLGDHGGDHGVPPDGAPSAAVEERPAAEPMRQLRRLRLVGTAGVVARSREFLREALHDWGWLPSETEEQRATAEDALLVVSELVTNACLHAGGPEELRVGYGTKTLRVEVVDGGDGDPALRTTRRAGRPGGHGMFIVERLCLDWGVTHDAASGGKTVWAEVAAPPGLA